MRIPLRALGALVVALASLTACADDDAGEITVLAAASLTDAFTEIAAEYTDRTGVSVRLSFDSSAALARQVNEGAPADVLATADEPTMQSVVETGAVEAPVAFAANEGALVVPADNPAGIEAPGDVDESVDYVRCVATAPCGAVADQMVAALGIGSAAASLEPDVRAVLARVVAGEADAGIVYATDAVAAGEDVRLIAVPEAPQVTAFAAAVEASTSQSQAQDFIALLEEPEIQDLLADAGFSSP